MRKRSRFKLSEKKYLVAIRIPSLDDKGRNISQAKIDEWNRKAQRELTECFGGATPLPAAAMNMVDGRLLFEQGQVLVLSGCAAREEFLEKRQRIREFVQKMGQALNQQSVFVLAYPSDSFLIEIE
jgi:hypothetical protein